MKKNTFFLLILIFALLSFSHKDLNEYGKWLDFYKLKDESFAPSGSVMNLEIKWKDWQAEKDYFRIYDSLNFYSPDSALFLDLYSYSLMPGLNDDGKPDWVGAEPDSRSELVDLKKHRSATLLFFGTEDYTETAIWRNDHILEICGFQLENKIYVPTIDRFDLQNKTHTVLKSSTTFSKPPSYLRKVRLAAVRPK